MVDNKLVDGEKKNDDLNIKSSDIIRNSNQQRSSSSKDKTKNRRLNIGLVGNKSVGKTSLIKRFALGDDFDNHRATVTTIGVDRTNLQVQVHNEPIDVVIWDPAGQEHLGTMTKTYFNQVDAIVLVFDMTEADTFEGVLRWFKQIKEVKECPIIILGNKCDKKDDLLVTSDDLSEVAAQCEIQCFETSAFTAENVDKAFLTII